MALQPAPQEVLEQLSCKCKKLYDKRMCCCVLTGLPCTDMCLIECDNMISNDTLSNHSSDDDSDLE